MTGNRRPSWLHLVCTPGNLAHLKARRCDGCAQWTLTCETDVWESYDPGVITGDDLTVAVILDRPLTRIEWFPELEQARLVNESMSRTLDPEATYLTLHRCGHTPISLTPFKPPKKAIRENTWESDAEPTIEDIRTFERVWKTPLSRLEKTAQ